MLVEGKRELSEIKKDLHREKATALANSEQRNN